MAGATGAQVDGGGAAGAAPPCAARAGRAALLPVLLPPALCGLAAFAPCCAYSEWYIDELFAVLRNEDARGESSWQQVFTNDFWGNPLRPGAGAWTHKSYRPLCVLSFTWQFWLLGGDLFRPQPLRAFNTALHATNSALVAALLRCGLRLSARWSCLAACLFALHPVHVENVVYLVGRADMLAATGWLVASLAHLRLRRPGTPGGGGGALGGGLLVGLCALLAVLSGLCKESGLTLLVFNAGVELCTAQAAPGRGVRLALAFLACFSALAACRFLITQGSSATFGFVDTPVQYNDDFWVRSWTYWYQHSFYARLLLLPGDLSWDYSYDTLPLLKAAWRDVRALAVCGAYLGLVALSAWSLSGRGSRRALLGLQSVIVPFIPASNLFFVVGVTVGERLLYPSTVGSAMVMAAIGQRAEQAAAAEARGEGAGRGRPRRWPAACGVALLLLYAAGCCRRVWQWRSSEALYEADARSWPRSLKSRHQLATVYHRTERFEEALNHYNASLAVLDDNALTDHCVAQIYIETGRYQEALERFGKIERGHGVGFAAFNLWMYYVDYGFTLVAMRRFEQGIPLLEQGLQRNTAVPHGLNAVGYAYASLQMLQEAQDWLAKGLEYDPDNPVIWNNIAAVWMLAGAFQNAAQGLEKALTLEPSNPMVVHNVLLLRRAAEPGVGSGVLDAAPQLELFFSRTT